MTLMDETPLPTRGGEKCAVASTPQWLLRRDARPTATGAHLVAKFLTARNNDGARSLPLGVLSVFRPRRSLYASAPWRVDRYPRSIRRRWEGWKFDHVRKVNHVQDIRDYCGATALVIPSTSAFAVSGNSSSYATEGSRRHR